MYVAQGPTCTKSLFGNHQQHSAPSRSVLRCVVFGAQEFGLGPHVRAYWCRAICLDLQVSDIWGHAQKLVAARVPDKSLRPSPAVSEGDELVVAAPEMIARLRETGGGVHGLKRPSESTRFSDPAGHRRVRTTILGGLASRVVCAAARLHRIKRWSRTYR
jgi:hypothetical protein